MMITELAKSKSKSGNELSMCNVAKEEKTKATKATLTKKGGKKKTGSNSPKKRSASSPKKMSASSPKTKTSKKAGSKKWILRDLGLCCQLMDGQVYHLMLLRNLIDSNSVDLNIEQFILVKFMAILLKILFSAVHE